MDRQQRRGGATHGPRGAWRRDAHKPFRAACRQRLETHRPHRRRHRRRAEEVRSERASGRIPARRSRYGALGRTPMTAMNVEPYGSPPANLVVEGVSKWFRTERSIVQALKNVSMRVHGGEFVCLV